MKGGERQALPTRPLHRGDPRQRRRGPGYHQLAAIPVNDSAGSAGPAFLWHFAMVQLLMIYFPFSKLTHTIGGIFNKLVMRS